MKEETTREAKEIEVLEQTHETKISDKNMKETVPTEEVDSDDEISDSAKYEDLKDSWEIQFFRWQFFNSWWSS